jgi:hypothetical protein
MLRRRRDRWGSRGGFLIAGYEITTVALLVLKTVFKINYNDFVTGLRCTTYMISNIIFGCIGRPEAPSDHDIGGELDERANHERGRRRSRAGRSSRACVALIKAATAVAGGSNRRDRSPRSDSSKNCKLDP